MLYSDYLKDKSHNAIKLNEVEGVPCILNYSKGKDLKNYEIYGDCYQSTRSGKNLLSSNATTSTLNGVTLTYDNGTITLNGTCDTSANFDLNNIVLSAGTYTLSANANKVSVSNNYAFIQLCDLTNKQYITLINSNAMGSVTTTISDGTFLYRIRIDEGTNYDNVVLKPQLEVGSTATEYEPYEVSPSPDYPSEVQSVGDLTTKNLLPYPYYETTKTINGVTITDNGDGSISLSGTSTGQVNFYFSQNLQLKKGITYTLSASGNYSFGGTASFYIYNSTYGPLAYISLNADNSYTFTPTKDIDGISCYIVIPSNRTVSGILKPQLEEGTIATKYEPYHKYDIPITVCGKNLFDISKIQNVTQSSTQKIIQNNDGTLTIYGPAVNSRKTLRELCPSLKVGDEVILSFRLVNSGTDAKKNGYIYILGVNMTWISGTVKVITDGILDGFVYFYCRYYTQPAEIAVGTISEFQIELGSTATSYEPYTPIQTKHIYLNEPLRKVGEYADYIDFKNQKVVRCVGEQELLSSSNYTAYSNGIAFRGFSINIYDMKYGTRQDGFCTHLQNIPNANSSIWFGVNGIKIYMSFPDIYNSAETDTERVAAFKAYLTSQSEAETPVKVVYPLATPIEESISLPTLKTVKGISIISVDTSVEPSNMKAKYVRL